MSIPSVPAIEGASRENGVDASDVMQRPLNRDFTAAFIRWPAHALLYTQPGSPLGPCLVIFPAIGPGTQQCLYSFGDLQRKGLDFQFPATRAVDLSKLTQMPCRRGIRFFFELIAKLTLTKCNWHPVISKWRLDFQSATQSAPLPCHTDSCTLACMMLRYFWLLMLLI